MSWASGPTTFASRPTPSTSTWGTKSSKHRTLTGRASTDARAADNRRAVDAFQRLHDICVVRPPAQPERQAVVHRGVPELGHCVLRIHAPGARKPDRQHGDGSLEAQDPAGSDYADGLRAVPDALHEAAVQARLPLGG